MGEMGVFYGASDLAFVGGSLVPIGGHNLLEPAVFALPIVSGPALFNFHYIATVLEAAQGMRIVEDGAELTQVLRYLFQHPEVGRAMGQQAHEVVQQNKGALDRLLDVVAQVR